MQTKDREPHTDNPATENLGTTTQMAEKHEIHSTDLVEQAKKVFVENLRGRGWRLIRDLEPLISDALANARLETVDPRATHGQDDPKPYARMLLAMDAVKLLVDSGTCEVRGAERKQEISLVAQDGAAEVAASPAATASNSDKTTANAVQSMPHLDAQSDGKDIAVLTANNKGATPNDATNDVDDAAIDMQADVDDTVAEPADNKTADNGVPELPSHPATKQPPVSDTTGTTTSGNRTMTTKSNAPQQTTEAQEEDVTAGSVPTEAAPDGPASEQDAEAPNNEHPVGHRESAALTPKRRAVGSRVKVQTPARPSDADADGSPGPSPRDGKLREVPVDELTTDPELQVRVKIDEDVVQEYADAMLRGDKFPPVRAVDDGKQLWPWDYAHRLLAARKSGAKTIAVLVTKGTREDALWFAARANQGHGLRLSNADKQRAFKMIQAHPRSKGLSMRDIAKIAGVSPQSASNYIKAQKGVKKVSKFDTKTACGATEDVSQTPSEQEGPAKTAESTAQAEPSPAPHDKTKEPAAPAGQPAIAAAPKKDERRTNEDAPQPSSKGQGPTDSAPPAVPNGEQKKGHDAAPSPAGNDPGGLSPDDKGAVKAGEQSMTDHNNSGAVSDAKVKTGDPSPEGSAKKFSLAELQRTLETTDRLLLQLSDQIRAELPDLPKAELYHIADLLENIREHARRILKYLP